MTDVEGFISEYDGEQRKLLDYFHHIFNNELELTSKIRFKIPFYYGYSWICYLNPIKSGGIELAFVRGNELSNAQGLLQSKGRKQVMSVEFLNVQDIPQDSLMQVVQEALLLDETKPYESKNKKSK